MYVHICYDTLRKNVINWLVTLHVSQVDFSKSFMATTSFNMDQFLFWSSLTVLW